LIRLHCVEGGGGEGDRGMRDLMCNRTGPPNTVETKWLKILTIY
jgi:hypothetical protein